MIGWCTFFLEVTMIGCTLLICPYLSDIKKELKKLNDKGGVKNE